MKILNLPIHTFMEGYFIDTKLCDDVIKYFDNNPQIQKEGHYYNTEKKQTCVDLDTKQSFDIVINKNRLDIPFYNYRIQLQECLNNYLIKYKYCDELTHCFNINEDYIIQKYPVGGGFKVYHTERLGGKTSKRNLVFMTYLNDVSDGGTMFYYQKLQLPAIKGLTLIWPSDWTHTHKGIISYTKEKYIITGWYSYNV